MKWLEAAQAAGLPHNPDFNGASQEGAGFFQFVIRDGERFGTGKAYLRPALTRANLTLKTSVRVTRIIIERSRAIGVEYLENGQPKSAFATGEVVLASGAIGSAQQLLLSGVGPADELKAAGVEVVHELAGVGRDLQDHINIPITFYTKEKIGVGAWTEESLAASLAEWETSRSGPRTSPWVAAGAHASLARALPFHPAFPVLASHPTLARKKPAKKQRGNICPIRSTHRHRLVRRRCRRWRAIRAAPLSSGPADR